VKKCAECEQAHGSALEPARFKRESKPRDQARSEVHGRCPLQDLNRHPETPFTTPRQWHVGEGG
jgi:hypothetical protein